MKINEIKPKVKEECFKLLDQDIKGQNEAVNALKEKFEGTSNKDLANIFKEAKEEWCKRCPTIEKENKAKSEEKEVSGASTPKDEKKGNNEAIFKQNKLLKVKYPITVEGEKGEYVINKDYVQAGELKFGSLEDIEEYKKKQLEEFYKHIAEIKEAFSYM